jgi:prepilin-type N-terminal cleavage/methylation domain-containing protein
MTNPREGNGARAASGGPCPSAAPRGPRRRDSRLRRAGFTLFELLLVLVLLALGTALVAPRIAPLAGRRMDSAIRQVHSAARHARSIAVTRGTGARLCFDAGARRWWLETETDPFGSPGLFEPPGDEWGAGAVLPEGVEFESLPAETVPFRPDGTAEDALVVFAGAGERRALEVRGYTGLSRILEEEEMGYRIANQR